MSNMHNSLLKGGKISKKERHKKRDVMKTNDKEINERKEESREGHLYGTKRNKKEMQFEIRS